MITIHEMMEYEWSAFYWSLDDERGLEWNKGEGSPIFFKDRDKYKEPTPADVKVNVHNPTNKDSRWFALIYQAVAAGHTTCQPGILTGCSLPKCNANQVVPCDDKYKDKFSCEDVREIEWTKKNAGYERWLQCWIYIIDEEGKDPIQEPEPTTTTTTKEPDPTPTPTPTATPTGRPEPPQPATWMIRFHQSMEYEWSEIAWVLVDPYGDEVSRGTGSPITYDGPGYPDFEKISIPAKTEVKVRDPTNKDKTSVTLVYLRHPKGGFGDCVPTWETGCSGPKCKGTNVFPCDDSLLSHIGCEDVRKVEWKPKGAGFERNFECTIFAFLGGTDPK
jgi:hypothetical protein